MSKQPKYYEEYCTLPQVNTKLENDGIAVIPNIISKKKLLQYKEDLWSTFREMTSNLDEPIRKSRPQSWRNIYELIPIHSMLIHHFNIGHCKLVWDIRQENKVIDTFAKIWNVNKNDLLTSFDGLSFHLPPEITKRGWYRGNDWYHTDQSRTKKELCCVQGMVTLFDINDGDASFCYMDKSHKLHQPFFDDHPEITSKSDWYKLKGDDYNYFKNCPQKRVKAKAGSLILWDSRLFHCGSEPLKTRKKPNFRGVIYVCMTPRDFSDERNMKKKIKAFNNSRTTSHWPHDIKIFSKKPHTYGQELADIKELEPVKFDDLTDIGKKLAGF